MSSEYFDRYIPKRRLNPDSAAVAVSRTAPGNTICLDQPDDCWLEDNLESEAQLVEESRNMENGYIYTILVFNET